MLENAQLFRELICSQLYHHTERSQREVSHGLRCGEVEMSYVVVKIILLARCLNVG